MMCQLQLWLSRFCIPVSCEHTAANKSDPC
ncbi:unnamed protein product [Tuber melanosporum]|uniref:(Perigord truffle) hypothetical protein n=1 Tax=Tuber melanosporum (strain Mel28) TaxID=656061 RepID=D5GNU9_TUBMM|nr:uncharacterized protein GSTUM_00011519001 [Tuber melanosporum]CAZ86192.1 unnamed protein product [Tuber melanosporum]